MDRRFASTLLLIASIHLVGVGDAWATAIINGDFATGDFTGWTASAIDQNGDPTTPLISVVDVGAFNVADFQTGTFADNVFISTLEQSFVVPADEPFLALELVLPGIVPDPTGTGTSPFRDAFFVSLASGIDFFDLLLVDHSGALPDPFGTAPGPVTLGAPLDAFFDFTFRADLSSLIGATSTLFMDVINEDDGFRFSSPDVGFVRTTFVAQSKVPEPGTYWLFAVGLILLIAVRTRQGESHGHTSGA